MPNLQGLKKDIPTQGDSTKILRIPSPAPSEPEYKTNNPELIQYQGPPKPPRDPSRLSMLDLHKSHHEVVRLGSRPIAGKAFFLGILSWLKFIYYEKATKFCEISTVDLTITT